MQAPYTDVDPIYFENYDHEAIHEILHTQHKLSSSLVEIHIATGILSEHTRSTENNNR